MLNKYVNLVAVVALAVSAGAVANAQSVTKTITLQNLPEQIAVDPVTNLIFVAVPNFGAKPFDYLTVIDGKKDVVIDNFEIPPYAYAVAIDPLTHEVYVGGTSQDANGVDQSVVLEYCVPEKRVVKEIHVSSTSGDGILGLAVNAITGDVYVSNGSDNEIDVIWRKSNKVDARISLSAEPFGVAVNPFSNLAYAALLDGDVSVINGKTYTITTTTVVPPTAPVTQVANAEITVDVVTGKVFTSNATDANASSVGVLGGAGNFIANVSVGNTPFGIDVDPITGLVFVANSQDGTVDAINSATNTVSKTLPVSGLFLALNPISEKVYVGANNGTPTVTVISEK
jgi:YVTN family beta-propeller protein